MQRMFNLRSVWILGAAAFGFMLTAGAPEAEARPPFVGVFGKQYPNLVDQAKKVKCAICHPTEDNKKKKIRNNYGKALAKAIGKKNEKDKKKVAAAMEKISKQDSAIEGKTFGDLIKEDKLPASTE